MRKSKRFIKKFSERFIIYIVVFVAFVNACFFVPMEVRASGTTMTMSDFLFVSEIFVNGHFVKSSNSNSIISASDNIPATSYGGSIPSTGLPSSRVAVFDYPITVYVNGSLLDSVYDDDGFLYLSGSLDFQFNLTCSEGASSTLSVSSVDVESASDGVVSAFFTTSAISGGRSVYTVLNFNDYTFHNSSYLYFNLTLHCTVVGNSNSNSFNITFAPSSFVGYGNVIPGPGAGSDSELAYGYDDSTGNQVSSDFESGVNDYDQVEDNLFNTSTGALQGFEFFDFGSFSAVTTGLSFCSSLLTSIYENFGGLNGIGIVISVLFSVLFMAIVIGLFRYYK